MKWFAALTVLVLVLAACQPVQPAAPAPQAQATEVLGSTRQPEPTAAAPAAAAMVNMATDAKLGDILVDEKGMTLYLFMKDTDGTSVCYDQCEKNWPPLLTTGAPVAGEGVTGKLGTTERKDGTQQVTYGGMPLYYYIKDTKPGDTTGQGVGDVWFVVPAAGAAQATPAPTAAASTGSAGGDDTGYGDDQGGQQAAGPIMIDVADKDGLGEFLVGAKGMTLYLFTKDSKDTTVCYDQCEKNWPPLLVPQGTQPAANDDAPGKLGVIERTDGTHQVTYDGWPLYYYIKDQKPGDTTGQGVGDVWFVVPPTGVQTPPTP